MTVTTDFYLARAAEALAEADKAVLANVRERNLRAAAAWQVMADRAVRTGQQRAEQEARKAAEAAALAVAAEPAPA
jgi:hypothetical protein